MFFTQPLPPLFRLFDLFAYVDRNNFHQILITYDFIKWCINLFRVFIHNDVLAWIPNSGDSWNSERGASEIASGIVEGTVISSLSRRYLPIPSMFNPRGSNTFSTKWKYLSVGSRLSRTLHAMLRRQLSSRVSQGLLCFFNYQDHNNISSQGKVSTFQMFKGIIV